MIAVYFSFFDASLLGGVHRRSVLHGLWFFSGTCEYGCSVQLEWDLDLDYNLPFRNIVLELQVYFHWNHDLLSTVHHSRRPKLSHGNNYSNSRIFLPGYFNLFKSYTKVSFSRPILCHALRDFVYSGLASDSSNKTN
jgi:hypothetical protein